MNARTAKVIHEVTGRTKRHNSSLPHLICPMTGLILQSSYNIGLTEFQIRFRALPCRMYGQVEGSIDWKSVSIMTN